MKIYSNNNDDESTASEETIIAKANESISPGDVIFYYHELYGARKEGERTAQVLAIDPDYKMKMLHLDNFDVLPKYHRVKLVKKIYNGILQDPPSAAFREIREFVLRKGELSGSRGRKSLLAQTLENRQTRFRVEYEKMAEEEGFPIDLVTKTSSSFTTNSLHEFKKTATEFGVSSGIQTNHITNPKFTREKHGDDSRVRPSVSTRRSKKTKI